MAEGRPPGAGDPQARIASRGDWQVGVAYARRRRYKEVGDLLTVVAYVYRHGSQDATLSTTDFVALDAQRGIRYAALTETDREIVDKFRDLMNLQDKGNRWQSLYLRTPGGPEGPAPAVGSGVLSPGLRTVTALWFLVPAEVQALRLHFGPANVSVAIHEDTRAA